MCKNIGDITLYLEDKVNVSFVNISEAEYKTALTDASNGIG